MKCFTPQLFLMQFSEKYHASKKPCRILNPSVATMSNEAIILIARRIAAAYLQYKDHPALWTGDPKHQPRDLDNETDIGKLPCLRQLNSLKRVFPVVIEIWSRQTLTTTRRAPKPYYRIELQKKIVNNRTVQTGKYSRLRDQQALFNLTITNIASRSRSSPENLAKLDSPLTTKLQHLSSR